MAVTVLLYKYPICINRLKKFQSRITERTVLVDGEQDPHDVDEEVPGTPVDPAQESQNAQKKRYVCSASKRCKREFATNDGLKNHIEIAHTSEKKFKCQECGKGFLRLRELKRHQELHLKPKITCSACGKVFTNNYRLKQHAEKHHTETNPECKICGTTFENNAELRIHNKTCLKKANKLKFQEKNHKELPG